MKRFTFTFSLIVLALAIIIAIGVLFPIFGINNPFDIYLISALYISKEAYYQILFAILGASSVISFLMIFIISKIIHNEFSVVYLLENIFLLVILSGIMGPGILLSFTNQLSNRTVYKYDGAVFSINEYEEDKYEIVNYYGYDDTLIVPDKIYGFNICRVSTNSISNSKLKYVTFEAKIEEVCDNALAGSKNIESIFIWSDIGKVGNIFGGNKEIIVNTDATYCPFGWNETLNYCFEGVNQMSMVYSTSKFDYSTDYYSDRANMHKIIRIQKIYSVQDNLVIPDKINGISVGAIETDAILYTPNSIKFPKNIVYLRRNNNLRNTLSITCNAFVARMFTEYGYKATTYTIINDPIKEKGLFKNNEYVINVFFEDDISILPDEAFYNASNIEKIVFKENISEVGYNVYQANDKLAMVSYSSLIDYFNIIFKDQKRYSCGLFIDEKEIKELNLTNNIRVLANSLINLRFDKLIVSNGVVAEENAIINCHFNVIECPSMFLYNAPNFTANVISIVSGEEINDGLKNVNCRVDRINLSKEIKSIDIDAFINIKCDAILGDTYQLEMTDGLITKIKVVKSTQTLPEINSDLGTRYVLTDKYNTYLLIEDILTIDGITVEAGGYVDILSE